MKLTLEEGIFLVKFARGMIAAHLGGKKPGIPENMDELMSKKFRVFVKLNRYPGHALRGSFGYTKSIIPLGDALGDVSIHAAFRDSSFDPLRKSELKTTLIEVSILSRPELIDVKDPGEYIKRIKVGRDGLIVEKDSSKGVLLPQMAMEFRWNPREFLSRACMKASLRPSEWQRPDTRIYRFGAQIFAEKEPCGEIIERKFA
jgi:uncharacterized protein (TIGR00296 family)